jgi:3-phytase
MKPTDNEGIQTEGLVAPMGVSLYKQLSAEEICAIVSPKEGSTENYFWQFLLKDDGNGNILTKW